MTVKAAALTEAERADQVLVTEMEKLFEPQQQLPDEGRAVDEDSWLKPPEPTATI